MFAYRLHHHHSHPYIFFYTNISYIYFIYIKRPIFYAPNTKFYCNVYVSYFFIGATNSVINRLHQAKNKA
jgi:hypothetical protein